MYCPKCKSEFSDGIKECPKCKTSLVKVLIKDDYLKFVTVFCSSNPALLAIAKSLLEDANIRYFVANENVQDFIGGRLTGFNAAIGGVEIKVCEENKEEADILLQDLLS